MASGAMSVAAMSDKRVVLGHISGLFGVGGWVKVYSHTRPIDNLLDYDRWFVERFSQGGAAQWRAFRVLQAKPHGKTLVAQLADAEHGPVTGRDAAAALVDARVAVARADMPALAPGEYYWQDLIGLEVVNRDAVALGRVTGMMETGANDVLVIEGERQRLIPFVIGVIVDCVDLETGRIAVDWDADF